MFLKNITVLLSNFLRTVYYDVGIRNVGRQTLYGSLRPIRYAMRFPNRTTYTNITDDQLIEIAINFGSRFLPTRLWEVKISQIPFSQRAPAGCLQYFTGLEGVMQVRRTKLIYIDSNYFCISWALYFPLLKRS